MKEVLLKYKIQTDSTTTSCIPPPKGFRTNCYISIMNKEIEKRHGKKFIESVRNEAEGKYAIRHLNMVFEFDECDTISRYPGTKNYKDFFEKPYVDFEKTFKYPKMYCKAIFAEFEPVFAEYSLILNFLKVLIQYLL